MKLFTVGYEGTHIEEFADFLKAKGVKLVADVRKNPISRKKGFSKNKLAENLRLKGIDYVHRPGLGVPSAWRKLNKDKKLSRAKMFRDYEEKILPEHEAEILELCALMKSGGLALLCYEADAADCHRSWVVAEMKRKCKRKFNVVDLQQQTQAGF